MRSAEEDQGIVSHFHTEARQKPSPKRGKKLLHGREIEATTARQQPKHASKNDRKCEQKQRTKTDPIPQASRAFPIGKPSCDLDLAGPPVAV